MNKEEILEVVKELSYSQGLYGRIYEMLKESDELLEELEKLDFKDPIDLILYIEQ